MVIQQKKQITVWGKADAGVQVTVSLQGKISETAADADGNWKALCGPFKVSAEEQMIVTSGEEKIVLQDVQIGEVWLAGGQSNMEFHMRYDADFASEKEVCANGNIRFFDYPEVSYVGQIDEADYSKNYGFWRKADPEQLERFSAVGYYFAKELHQRLRVPVGIIGCNWGGTPACAWMSQQAIVEGGGQIYLDEYEAAVEKLDLAEYEEKFRRNPGSWRIDQLADPISDIMMFGCTMEEMGAKLLTMGVDLSELDSTGFAPVVGPKYERRPSGLYEAMLKPLAPYTIRGFIWYQGETDGDQHPEVYKTLFPALIRNWRELWNEELPFLFTQIAPLDRWMTCIGERYVEIRAAQQHTADTVPGTGMAVITDVGMQFDIHPKKKQPVGYRLALLARNNVYGETLLCEAPALASITVEDDCLTLRFDHSGDGLYLADTLPYGQKVDGQKLGGLQVFQNGKELPAQSMRAQANGNQVIITGENICSGVPTQIKLAETGWYLVNLYNGAGIPARPAHAEVFSKANPI